MLRGEVRDSIAFLTSTMLFRTASATFSALVATADAVPLSSFEFSVILSFSFAILSTFVLRVSEVVRIEAMCGDMAAITWADSEDDRSTATWVVSEAEIDSVIC